MNTHTAPWKVAFIGECMIELQRNASGNIEQTFGGDTLNTAVYLSRIGETFGVEAEYVSALGDDRFSSAMRSFWHAERVGSSFTRNLPGRMPGLYFIEVDPSGERHFSYWRGEAAAKDCFDGQGGADILESLYTFDAVYLSGISLAILREEGRQRLLETLACLKGMGKLVAFDFNFRPRLWQGTRTPEENASSWYIQTLAASTVAFLSREECVVLGLPADADGTTVCQRVRESGPGEVLVKDGPLPCVVTNNGSCQGIPPSPLGKVVDTTAAGDSFSAAYLMGRRLGLDATEAARRAHTLAARVISYRGAIIPANAMPDLFSDFTGLDSPSLHARAAQ